LVIKEDLMKRPFFKGGVKMSRERISVTYEVELPINKERIVGHHSDRFFVDAVKDTCSCFSHETEPYLFIRCGAITFSDFPHFINGLKEVAHDFQNQVT